MTPNHSSHRIVLYHIENRIKFCRMAALGSISVACRRIIVTCRRIIYREPSLREWIGSGPLVIKSYY